MLTGQAKKDYQREYMRGYMRERRKLVKTQENAKTFVVKTQTDYIDGRAVGMRISPPVEETIHDRLARIPLALLEKQGVWIPNWRRELA